MSLIHAQNLAKSYGAQDVFRGVDIAIPHQARIALVGSNGVGKTTLLRILAGLEVAEGGNVQRARKLRFGFLPQESLEESWRSQEELNPWEYCLQAFDHLRQQEVELARLEQTMADPRSAEDAIARYGDLQEQFENAGGYTYPLRVRRVLNGLGLAQVTQRRPMKSLSGGERTRVELARLLLDDPDLLILDEPTNHLDMRAVEWLEAWLKDWPGAALIVSHDRYFLDRTVDTIWELTSSGIEHYRGNYSAYRLQRVERRESQIKQYRATQERIKKEEDFIRRNIAGQNTRQAQGRRTRLERYIAGENQGLPRNEETLNLSLGSIHRSGDRVIECKDLIVGYQDSEPLFAIPELLLLRGECAAIIGPNGSGKTTLLKTIVDTLPVISGQLRLGASLKIGFFDQAQADLEANASVMDEILKVRPDLLEHQVRSILGKYQFQGDDVFKSVINLSGGERSRLAIVKIILQDANLLLLDEPTSHLDIPAQEQLEEALREYPGTILIVTHDRFLVQALASQIWEVNPEDKRLEITLGDYQEYLDARVKKTQLASKANKQSIKAPRPSSGRTEIEDLEQHIAQLERKMVGIAAQLESVEGNYQEAQQLAREYAGLESQLETKLDLWAQLAQEQSQA